MVKINPSSVVRVSSFSADNCFTIRGSIIIGEEGVGRGEVGKVLITSLKKLILEGLNNFLGAVKSLCITSGIRYPLRVISKLALTFLFSPEFTSEIVANELISALNLNLSGSPQ